MRRHKHRGKCWFADYLQRVVRNMIFILPGRSGHNFFLHRVSGVINFEIPFPHDILLSNARCLVFSIAFQSHLKHKIQQLKITCLF